MSGQVARAVWVSTSSGPFHTDIAHLLGCGQLASWSGPGGGVGTGVVEGTAAVHRGSDIFIEGGSYNERFVIDKPMTLNAILGAVTIGE